MLNFGRFCKDISWNLLWFGSWFDCLLVKLLTDPCCLYYLRLLYVFTNDNPSALDETFHWAPAIKILGHTGASNRFMHAVDFCRSVGIYGLQRLYLFSILVREFVYLLLKLRMNIVRIRTASLDRYALSYTLLCLVSCWLQIESWESISRVIILY